MRKSYNASCHVQKWQLRQPQSRPPELSQRVEHTSVVLVTSCKINWANSYGLSTHHLYSPCDIAWLKSHHHKHLSASHLTPYEILLTCDITLSCYNKLNLATLLPLHSGKTTHYCLILTGQLLTLSSDLQLPYESPNLPKSHFLNISLLLKCGLTLWHWLSEISIGD